MNVNADLPLNLHKANLELQLRLGRLLQENQRKWLELSSRAISEGIAESSAELEQVLKTQDWQALAALPGEAFWRQLQQRMGDSQALTQMAISAQTAFAAGLQEALQAWQKETAQALSGAGDFSNIQGIFNDMLQQWNQFWPGAAGAGQNKGAKGASSAE
jgi:post-segregation antitoxin (ccd killing protein)